MSHDRVETLARFASTNDMRMLFLSDPMAAIIAAFDLIDPDYPPGSRWHGLARPAAFAIDTEGAVTHRWTDPNYRWRPDVDDVLRTLKQAR